MDNFVEIFNAAGVIVAAAISAATLFATRAQQRSQQQTSIMATKRSERIDKMRECSAGILTCVQHILNDLGDKDTKKALLGYAHTFISLLQYQAEYTHDVLLVTKIHSIVKLSLSEPVDKEELGQQLKAFWWTCNVYIGSDFERLKEESKGDYNKGGEIDKEATSFEGIFQKFNKDYDILFPNDAKNTED